MVRFIDETPFSNKNLLVPAESSPDCNMPLMKIHCCIMVQFLEWSDNISKIHKGREYKLLCSEKKFEEQGTKVDYETIDQNQSA